MTWVAFALIGPLFWTLSVFVDKFLLDKMNRGVMVKGVADYAFFGSISPVLILIGLPLFFDVQMASPMVMGVTALGGFLLHYSFLMYGIVLSKADSSQVVPIFQLRSPIVLLVGAMFFGEFLTHSQLIAFGVIFAGALLLSLDFAILHKPKFNSWTFLAVLATTIFAIVLLINKYGVTSLDIPSVTFFFNAGFLLASFSFFVVPSWRREIIEGLRASTWKKFFLFALIDISDELGQLFSKFALIAAPATALVAAVQGVQSLYILIGGVVLTIWFPHIIQEQIHLRALIQKGIGAIVVFLGIVLLNI
jgi:uncharacterized membrane protein